MLNYNYAKFTLLTGFYTLDIRLQRFIFWLLCKDLFVIIIHGNP